MHAHTHTKKWKLMSRLEEEEDYTQREGHGE
jgi:hypothetical protein